MTKPFMFTGLGVALIAIWSFLSSVNWGAVAGCVAGYSLIDMLF